MSIERYRKKPVEIDAMRFEYTSKCLGELKEWMGHSPPSSCERGA